MKTTRFLLSAFVVSMLSTAAALAQIPPNGVLGASVVVNETGPVTATFVSGSGFYDNYLYLDNVGSPYANPGGLITPNYIFQNHLTPPGTTVDLGIWPAGTELFFHVGSDTHLSDFSQNPNGVLDWYTGPASRNADGFAHAFVDPTFGVNTSLVGFEDLSGLGDALFEDLRYSFSNTRALCVCPDTTGTLALLASSFAGLLAIARRSACVR